MDEIKMGKEVMWFHLRLLERCNLRCRICYAKDHDRSPLLDADRVGEILKLIKSLQGRYYQHALIYLSGGEPLIHPRFFDILEKVNRYFDRMTLLTNGLLIKKYLSRLVPYRDKLCIQVSLDGSRKINDSIRGDGVYDKVIEALLALKKMDMKHWISYTVSQENKHCYKDIIDVSAQTNSLYNNVTPYTGDPKLMLDYYEWKEFKYNYTRYANKTGWNHAHSPSSCGFVYRCGARYGGMTIHPDGKVSGCARMPGLLGDYREMERFFIPEPYLMNRTCMKDKWGEIPNFKFLTDIWE